MGEETHTPASRTGRLLQRWILAGLTRATALACVSRATFADAQKLVTRNEGTKLEVITLGLSYPYGKLPQEHARARLKAIAALPFDAEFALHVGSNLYRKNRAGVLRIFARSRLQWNGWLVFAGEPLSTDLRSLAGELGVAEWIVEIREPSSETLEALYNCANALVFPSTFEGFGWPIAEAHACGCPVICTAREPMIEVVGEAGITRALDDEEGFASDLTRLSDPAEREHWSVRALENARRFSTARMISEYRELYRSVASLA
jgi:glycosyltransferase involved in cell wall biosynthesis